MSKRKSTLAEAFQVSSKQREGNAPSAGEQAEAQDTVKQGSPQPMINIGEVELVPGFKGQSVPADQPVNMTFTVTAKERYLWNLELSRRGLTGVSVLRRALNDLLES